jgi:LCP family protein required for cell wall assembly
VSSARTVGRLSARVTSGVVSFLLLVLIGYGWKNLHDLNAGTQTLPGIAAIGKPAPGVTEAPVAADHTAQNILIVGNDDRNDMTDTEVHELHTGRSGGSLNTDTMMIVHIPADGTKATIISLPRDSYVHIPGFIDAKLNAAYPDGYVYNAPSGASEKQHRAAGANELIKAVRDLTGLTINHFAEVDLIGFYRISEAIGPISVDLCHATSDPTGSHFTAPAGKQTIVGVRALEFVRQRDGVPGGDVGRAARQRYFLTAAFRRIESANVLLNPVKLHRLIQAVDKSIFIDNDNFSLVKLAAQLADLNPNDIIGKPIPTDGYATRNGQSVLLVNPTKVRAWASHLLYGPHTHSGKHAHKPKPIDSGCIN